jgi:hypothetical protein
MLEFAELVFNGVRPLDAANMILTPLPWVTPQHFIDLTNKWQNSKFVKAEIKRLESIVPTPTDVALMCFKLSRHPHCSDENKVRYIRLAAEVLKYLSKADANLGNATDDTGHMYDIYDALKADQKKLLEESVKDGTK